jgi:hypothetical protein
MINANRGISFLLMNNKIVGKNIPIIQNTIFTPAIQNTVSSQVTVKQTSNPSDTCLSMNDEYINFSYTTTYNYSDSYSGLQQAKALKKEEYNPFRHQMGKD